MMLIGKDYHLMGIQNIYLDYLLDDLVMFSFLVLSQSPVSSDNSFMWLFSLPSPLKYILKNISKDLCHYLTLHSPPCGIFIFAGLSHWAF